MNEKNPSGIVFDITKKMSDVLNDVEHIYAKTERIRNFLLGTSKTATPAPVDSGPHNIVPVTGWLLQQDAILDYLVELSAKIDVLLNDLLREGMDKDNEKSQR